MEKSRSILKQIGFKNFISSKIRELLRAFAKLEIIKEPLLLRDTANILYNGSSLELLNDAIRGVLMLQATYNLNITKLTYEDIETQNNALAVHTKRHPPKLTAQDLIAIGKQAFIYSWYDTSILYLLDAHNLLMKNKGRPRQLEALNEFLTSVVAYHNAKLHKFGSSIGTNWKAFNYIVQLGMHDSIITIFNYMAKVHSFKNMNVDQ